MKIKQDPPGRFHEGTATVGLREANISVAVSLKRSVIITERRQSLDTGTLKIDSLE